MPAVEPTRTTAVKDPGEKGGAQSEPSAQRIADEHGRSGVLDLA